MRPPQAGRHECANHISEDPGATAELWLKQGRNGCIWSISMALTPVSRRTEPAIRDIVAALDGEVPIQLGGGIRSMETIERYLDDGISWVIIGTAA